MASKGYVIVRLHINPFYHTFLGFLLPIWLPYGLPASALPGFESLFIHNCSAFTGNTNLLVKRFYFTVTDERPQEYDFKAPECLLVDDTWSLNCADDFSGVVQPADKNRFALTTEASYQNEIFSSK